MVLAAIILLLFFPLFEMKNHQKSLYKTLYNIHNTKYEKLEKKQKKSSNFPKLNSEIFRGKLHGLKEFLKIS